MGGDEEDRVRGCVIGMSLAGGRKGKVLRMVGEDEWIEETRMKDEVMEDDING